MLLTLLLCPKTWAMPKAISDAKKMRIIQEEWNDQQKNNLKITHTDSSLPVVTKKMESDLPKEFFEKISLKANDLELSEVLKPLKNAVSCHLTLGPGVEDKKLSVDLSNVTILKALDTILFPLGYGFKVKEGDLIILAAETRVYQIVLPPIIQSFSDLTSNRDNARIQSATTSIRTLRTATENYLSNGNLNYTGISVTTLQTANLLPTNFTPTGSNPWGGNFTVGPNAADSTHVDISLTSLSQAQATKLTNYFSNNATSIVYDGAKSAWTVTF
jgi:hypothetical protein